jgi:hypothetical protein
MLQWNHAPAFIMKYKVSKADLGLPEEEGDEPQEDEQQ